MPLVPVIVRLNVPVGIIVVVVTVMVDAPDPGNELGLKLAVAPAGSPVALKVTTPLNPPTEAIVAMNWVLFPCTTVWEEGEAEMVKSGAVLGFTTSVTVVL